MTSRVSKHNSKKRRKLSIIIIILLLLISLVAYGISRWNQAKKETNDLYTSSKLKKERNVSQVIKDKKPLSVLLLGTDTGALNRNFKGRTDTIIVATFNPKKHHMTMVSIPRDAAVVIPGAEKSAPSKINAAYDVGGAKASIKAVQKLLNIPIDFYGLVNMGGLEKIVDSVGGVDVKPPLTFHYKEANVKKGVKIHLDGAAALSYSRMRDDDPLGDYGRQVRQRQVLMGILRNSDSIQTLLNHSLMKSFKNQAQTDLTFDDIVALSNNYRVATHHLKSYHLQGFPRTINRFDYVVTYQRQRQKVTNLIRKALDLPPKLTGVDGLTVQNYNNPYANPDPADKTIKLPNHINSTYLH